MPLVIRLDGELESGLRALAAPARMPPAEVVRQLIRERLTLDKKRKSAFEIALEMGVIGMDDDPCRDTANQHSKHVKAALRGKRSA